MSTHASIWCKQKNGTWKGIYCHFDGYVDCVGRTLYFHYDRYEDALALVNLGGISSLEDNIEEIPTFAQRGEPVRFWLAKTEEEALNKAETEYAYFFDPEVTDWETKRKGAWHYYVDCDIRRPHWDIKYALDNDL